MEVPIEILYINVIYKILIAIVQNNKWKSEVLDIQRLTFELYITQLHTIV